MAPRQFPPRRRFTPAPCPPCKPGTYRGAFGGGPASTPWNNGGRFTSPLDVPGAAAAVSARLGPDPVPLLSAAFFKILTKAGITNVPTSQIIGNMGVSPITSAAITGFALVLDGSGQFSTSSQVDGRVYAADYAPPTPAMLTQAVLDMEAAYTDAASRTPDVTGLNAGLIGGLTLAPGTYRWNSNVLIASDLILAGGPNDTWIFQVNGTLDLAAAMNIIMIGGAVPANVIWQVTGAVTIGPGATFRGNILAQTNVAVQTGASVFGKLLAQTAVTLDNNLVNG
jgi:hypothetical protein